MGSDDSRGRGLYLASSPAKSDEQLCTKYGKCVPASAFECSDVSHSSLVTRVCYSAPKEYMVVRLNMSDYHYCSIPADVVAAFMAAESIGKFYNQNIKSAANSGLYDCRSHQCQRSSNGSERLRHVTSLPSFEHQCCTLPFDALMARSCAANLVDHRGQFKAEFVLSQGVEEFGDVEVERLRWRVSSRTVPPWPWLPRSWPPAGPTWLPARPRRRAQWLAIPA